MAAEIRTSHSVEVEELLNRIELLTDGTEEFDIEELKNLCDQLFEYAAEEQADDLLASYYAAYLRYMELSGTDAGLERCALEGIKYQKRVGRVEQVIKTYVSLSDYAEKMGDTLRQVRYLFEAMTLSRDNSIYYGAAIIADRIALLYRQSECYDKAVEMSRVAQENMEMSGHWEMIREEYPRILINKGYSLMAIDKGYELKKTVKLLEQYIDYVRNTNIDYPAFEVHTFMANYAFYRGDSEMLRSNISIAKARLQHLKDYSSKIDSLSSFINIIEKKRNWIIQKNTQ